MRLCLHHSGDPLLRPHVAGHLYPETEKANLTIEKIDPSDELSSI